MPKDGPSDGSRMHSIAFLPMTLSASVRPDRGRGLSLACRRRIDRADQNELAVRVALDRLDEVHRYLGLVVAIGFEILRSDAQSLAGNVQDQSLLCGLENFNVGLGTSVLGSAGRRLRRGRGRRVNHCATFFRRKAHPRHYFSCAIANSLDSQPARPLLGTRSQFAQRQEKILVR